MTAHLARFATVHWIRFPSIVTPDQLSLSGHPSGCVSWKIGPDGPVGPDGYRLPSDTWCGVALFSDLSAAERALAANERFLPSLAEAVESWHALLVPIAHRGECNHLERTNAGPIFEIESQDPGGPLLVMTTAGFSGGPQLDMARVIHFRVHVDRIHDWLKTADGRVASQVFTPHTVGDDGVTMSIWRSDSVMVDTMYRPGIHRTQLDRHKRENLADRTSFTRFRVLRTSGQWGGTDPVEVARSSSS
jgi:hypothetical protein